MGKIDKLIKRFLIKPKDLTWSELIMVLNHYGYYEISTGKTGGSRRKFSDNNKTIISFHKPHPKLIVKIYVIEQVIDHLKEKGKIRND